MTKLLSLMSVVCVVAILGASCKNQSTPTTETQNRAPAPAMLSGPSNAIVICSSCAYQGMPREGHLILMDSRTGQIWGYSDDAIAGRAAPIYVGTLDAVGKPIKQERTP
jgi:hypothetical protein